MTLQFSRFCFVLALCAFSAVGQTPVPLTKNQLARLQRALEPYHANYNPEEKMLREPFRSPGYHTTLKAKFTHPTRSSLTYAFALLDTGDDALRRRAEDILRRVIGLQDQNPASKTYGIWPWFLEEPLEKMSPPDWNWADFCGVQLLQVARDHRQRLTPEVASLVDTAIRHASRSIQRRNVRPGYTNIAIMGAYVTLVAAEMYGWDDLREYATRRFRNFYDHTIQQGSFTEFNSPTYSIVALSELGRMRLHVKDAESRRLVEELYRMAWEDIAAHFHPPTRQWAGPHSRCYSTLLTGKTLAVIQRATEGRVNFGVDEPALDEHRLPLPCPRDLEALFTTLDAPRDVVKTYLKAEPPIIGTTRLEPLFALGTVNRGDLWNQRRSLVAYWGTTARPSYLRLRMLRDGYDFAAAQFFSAQRGGDVLAAVNFAVNGGNTHVSLDRLKDGVFHARNLRLRFEFGGKEKILKPRKLSDPAVIRSGDVRIHLATPFAVFGNETPQWEAGDGFLDLVLYQGETREFKLAEMPQAAIGLAVRIAGSDSPPPAVTASVRDGRLTLAWEQLRLDIPIRPGTAADLQRAVKF